jgi:hypothetical protein
MGRGTELIEYLSQALQHLDVSGFELLEFLDVRSRLAMQEPLLSQSDRTRLEAIDRQLLQMAPSWLARISEVADLAETRQRARALPSHWWWYLDEITLTGQSAKSTAS